jgi:hypothetical protein
MKKSELKKAKPENVIRLAQYLKLHIEGMSTNQVIKLVYWRLHKNRQWQGYH